MNSSWLKLIGKDGYVLGHFYRNIPDDLPEHMRGIIHGLCFEIRIEREHVHLLGNFTDTNSDGVFSIGRIPCTITGVLGVACTLEASEFVGKEDVEQSIMAVVAGTSAETDLWGTWRVTISPGSTVIPSHPISENDAVRVSILPAITSVRFPTIDLSSLWSVDDD